MYLHHCGSQNKNFYLHSKTNLPDSEMSYRITADLVSRMEIIQDQAKDFSVLFVFVARMSHRTAFGGQTLLPLWALSRNSGRYFGNATVRTQLKRDVFFITIQKLFRVVYFKHFFHNRKLGNYVRVRSAGNLIQILWISFKCDILLDNRA